ncbi:histidine kinase [Dysgonomonas alginatilytica]|uniref:Histidine kinase n=1 Tax=Dysgonomonas alginatilytica TaxID=1605892 RepID=A0A2V3PI97_9BACT|nr:histidine kinase [Dysgonomonas alginatilytica]PXV58943.1 histidine kinase [Dysgonomonas alginatilytica]
MNILDKHSTSKLLLFSLITAIFIIYPNITWLPWELSLVEETKRTHYLLLFGFRYAFYTAFILLLIKINLQKIKTLSFQKRFGYNALISIGAYAIYGGTAFLIDAKVRHFGSLVLFQFLIVCILDSLIGYIYLLFIEQRKKEQEIEQLKIENLQSRYDALTNQINPHFFFNSLNGLTSLIRKKNDGITLTYVNKLSDVFRYILQSDKKGLVTLEEELEFVNSFRYMMEVRFANKLEYNIDVDPKIQSTKLPVLSILPLLDNIVVHNMIDSDHKMTVSIYLNDNKELVVSNPIYPKLSLPATNGTGLKNLENRFSLLMNKQIRVENNGSIFSVYLPLK